MIAAYEVMVATSPVRALIKEGKTHQLRNSVLTGQRTAWSPSNSRCRSCCTAT